MFKSDNSINTNKKITTYIDNLFSEVGASPAYICENFTCREPLVGMDELPESGYI
jgi:hypothetical protein